MIATSTKTTTVSVGEVNGRVFLNNSSIGLYPAVLKQRESTYRRFGRSQAAAYLSAALVLIRPSFLDLEVTADGVPIDRRTPLLFVAVNPHQMEEFGIPGDECVEDRRLAMYVTRPLSPVQLWGLGLRGFFRGNHGAGDFEVLCAREALVGVRRKRVQCGDGRGGDATAESVAVSPAAGRVARVDTRFRRGVADPCDADDRAPVDLHFAPPCPRSSPRSATACRPSRPT